MNYAPDVKNRRLQVVIDAIGADGLLKIGTAGMGMTLSVVKLQTPAFTSPQNGEMSLAGKAVFDPRARSSGKAQAAQITTASGKIVIDGLTVGKSDADIEITSDQIQEGQEVRIASGTIVHA
jgi:hypothetical protein